MGTGIAPERLASQVANTASWALEAGGDAARAVQNAPEIEAAWSADPFDARYLELMLAAHYLTVGTFVPTDVDTRIRHHHWIGLDRERLRAGIDVVERVATWDPRLVSERVARVGNVGSGDSFVSGHEGEWLSVRAGALGAALALEDDESIARLENAIDEERAREAELYQAAERGDVLACLAAATLLAHNTGDLSRVVAEWPAPTKRHARAAELATRYTRLGHEGDARFGGCFVRAGALNKRFMAHENHRFLPLREPRALRRARALLLPIGPFFDAWGRVIATHESLDEGERTSVLSALLDLHERKPDELGCVRAMIGLGDATRGGLQVYARNLPARRRKLLQTGALPRLLAVPQRVFEDRLRSQAGHGNASRRA